MIKMAQILEEVAALESTMDKVASSKGTSTSALASFLDKMAEESSMEDEESEDEKEEKEEESEESMKEGSMKPTKEDELVNKIANAVLGKLSKVAVLDTSETQGSTVSNTAGGSNDGAATNAARKEDQLISGASVDSAAGSNPNAHNPSINDGKGDLIVNQAPNVEGMADALQKAGHVVYTRKEAEILEKFASIGYEHVVDVYSDKIVQEKVAQAIVAEQAKDAPQKIAKAILTKQNEKTASNEQANKLAQLKKNDPECFAALQVLADRGLI